MSSFDTFSMDGDQEIHTSPPPPQTTTTTTTPFDDDFTSYSSFSGEVTIDHVSSAAAAASSPDIFGYDDGSSDPNMSYSSQSPFDAIHVENGNGNGNGYGGGDDDDDDDNDAVFVSDGPVLPSPMEMGPEEGIALRDWRR